VIIVQDHREIHVVANRVNPVRGANAAAIAVTGVHEHCEIRPRELDALGDREGAPVDTVEAVRLHIMRQPARAADARDEHGALGLQILVATEPLHRGENRVVAATAAPPRHAALIILEIVTLRVELDQAFGDWHRHRNSPKR
jgi:hypothetical protein